MLSNFIDFIRTGKTAKQREEKMREFGAMLERFMKPKRTVLKTIPVAENLVLEFLTKNQVRTPSGQRDFWKFVYANFPVQETDNIRISCQRITAPVLEILAPEGKEEDEIVTKVTIKPEDEDELFSLLTLSQADEAGPVEKYNLWKAIETKYPEVIGFKNRAITLPDAIHIAIVERKGDSEDDE